MDQPTRPPLVQRCRRKFLEYFPEGFRDADYVELERGYKVETHERWHEALGRSQFNRLLQDRRYAEIAARAVRVEQRSRHSMIFSFEKMALRDAVKTPAGARIFAEGLFELLHGRGALPRRFETWVEAVASLPRRQTRVLTWPLVTRRAAKAYGFELAYSPRPSWEVYASLLEFAERVRRDTRDLGPRDMIDLQSFIWVQGSDEY